jgi:signal transduction histidine kinase
VIGATVTLGSQAANVTLTEERLSTMAGGGAPGEHVCLSVRDRGTGMTPEVIAKALDPFYTTKPEGAGTGLGLATVYGILSKTGGHLHIASRPGHGTTIETYWPVAQAAQETAPARTHEARQLPCTSDGLAPAIARLR